MGRSGIVFTWGRKFSNTIACKNKVEDVPSHLGDLVKTLKQTIEGAT